MWFYYVGCPNEIFLLTALFKNKICAKNIKITYLYIEAK